MCFSSTASFGAAALLSAAGIATLKNTRDKSEFPFAVIPFLFAIQQFIEGLLWLSLTDKNYADLHLSAAYGFLFFAQLVWPVWVPLSIYLIEKDNRRKIILFAFLQIGLVLAVFLLYRLYLNTPTAEISGNHIRYEIGLKGPSNLFYAAFYAASTIIPPFISSVNKINYLGACIAASFLLTYFFYREHIISVWCYFAAITSVIIYFILKYSIHSKFSLKPHLTKI